MVIWFTGYFYDKIMFLYQSTREPKLGESDLGEPKIGEPDLGELFSIFLNFFGSPESYSLIFGSPKYKVHLNPVSQ